MPSAFAHDFYMYPTSTEPRRLQAGIWDVTPEMTSDIHMESGSAVPSETSILTTSTMMTHTGPLDFGNLVYALANKFNWRYTSATGTWDFQRFTGRVAGSGFNAPQPMDQFLMYGNFTNTNAYIADDPVLDTLRLQIMGEGQSQMTQGWMGKRLTVQTPKPAAPVVGILEKPYVRRNADWIVTISSTFGVTTTATLLQCDLNFPSLSKVFYDLTDTSGDTSWDDSVDRRFQQECQIQFLADNDWTDYFTDVHDDFYYVTIRTNDGAIDWRQRVKLTAIPQGFQDSDDLYVINLTYTPVAVNIPLADGADTVGFTAATTGTVTGFDSTGTTTQGALGAPNGFAPDNLTEIHHDSSNNTLTVGPASAWDEDFRPTTVSFDGGTTTFALTYDMTNDVFTNSTVTTGPITAGAATATFDYDWTPDEYLRVQLANSPITSWM